MNLPDLPPPDAARAARTRERLDALTKPQGSLGALEHLAVRLASIAPLPPHGYARRAVLIGAADHGVAAAGVSAYPQAVTAQMIRGFLHGTAAVNALARSARAEVYVADFGVATELPEHPRLIDARIGAGTRDMSVGPAMTRAACEAAIAAGMRAADRVLDEQDAQILALGDMGIGNTTSAAAVIASLTDTPANLVVGRGTGIADAVLERKRAIVAAAVARCADADPQARAAALGGFEISGLAGAMIAAAARRVPVVLDGVIVCAAALVARAFAPRSTTAMIASHRSVEPGHGFALAALGLVPYMDLELRLGEGTGAVLALGFCDAAARVVTEMHTFAEAGVATAEAEITR